MITYDDNRQKFEKDIRYITEKFRNLKEDLPSVMEYYGKTMVFDELMEKVPIKSKDYIELAQKMDLMKQEFAKDTKTYKVLSENILN